MIQILIKKWLIMVQPTKKDKNMRRNQLHFLIFAKDENFPQFELVDKNDNLQIKKWHLDEIYVLFVW